MAYGKTRDIRGDQYIDSRDVIARLEELESKREAALEETTTIIKATEENVEIKGWDSERGTFFVSGVDWDEEQEEEYQALKELNDEAPGDEWTDGAQMIRDDKFEDYAQELAKDIGALKDCDHWPATCIDWEQAASELQMDYTSVEFAGYTYWVR